MTDTITITAATADRGTAALHNVVLFLSRTPFTPTCLEPPEKAIRAAASAYGRAALLFVMDPRDPIVRPTAGTREIAAEFLRRTVGLLGPTAVVVCSDGFAGAALRALATGAMLVARPSAITKVFGDVGEATRWLSREIASGPAPHATDAEISAAFESLRARVAAGR